MSKKFFYGLLIITLGYQAVALAHNDIYAMNQCSETVSRFSSYGRGLVTVSHSVLESESRLIQLAAAPLVSRFLYVLGQEALWSYGVGEFFDLFEISRHIKNEAGTVYRSIAVDPMNRYLFVMTSDAAFWCNRTTIIKPMSNAYSIVPFLIDSQTGELTRGPVTTLPYEPQSIAIDPSGKYLVVSVFQALRIYEINSATGELIPITEQRLACGDIATQLFAVAARKDKTYLFAMSGGCISSYEVLDTGVLRAVGLEYGSREAHFAAAQFNDTTFIFMGYEDSITKYQLNASTGALENRRQIVIKAHDPDDPVAISGLALSENSEHLYATSFGIPPNPFIKPRVGKVYEFTVDREDGGLQLLNVAEAEYGTQSLAVFMK